MQIELDSMLRKAIICLDSKFMPSHDAFSISEVLGACTGIPKEMILDQMMKMRQTMKEERDKKMKKRVVSSTAE